MARPKSRTKKITLELQLTPKLARYLDDLVKLEGFGETRQEVIKKFVWDGVNAALPKERLKQR